MLLLGGNRDRANPTTATSIIAWRQPSLGRDASSHPCCTASRKHTQPVFAVVVLQMVATQPKSGLENRGLGWTCPQSAPIDRTRPREPTLGNNCPHLGRRRSLAMPRQAPCMTRRHPGRHGSTRARVEVQVCDRHSRIRLSAIEHTRSSK